MRRLRICDDDDNRSMAGPFLFFLWALVSSEEFDAGWVEQAEVKVASYRCPEGAQCTGYGCMPRKYLEKGWTCWHHPLGNGDCNLLGVEPCLSSEEYNEMKENPCAARDYPLQFNRDWAKERCQEKRIEKLEARVEELETKVIYMERLCYVAAL
jgi:hypothetical protein